MSELEFRLGRADSPEAGRLLADYERELVSLGVVLNHGSPGGISADLLVPPQGAFVLVWRGGDAVACGGVRMLGREVCEIKRMYVDPSERGAGLARRLLAHLEGRGQELGARAVRLDTGRDMAPAVALYRSSGYIEIDDYNGNPDAGWWFEKKL
jgi:GNAT superfamily N-acetyltransferase